MTAGEAPRVGIIGPSRRRNGTGGFVARFLHGAGAHVAAVAATRLESAEEAARRLGAELGRAPSAWPSPADMVREAELDAVVICSPFPHHGEHLGLALEAGLHVLCEKPLVWRDGPGAAESAARWAERFEAAGLVLQHNAQWPFVLEALAPWVAPSGQLCVRRLELGLSPSAAGPEMYPESMPHLASLLAALGATGEVRLPRARWGEGLGSLELDFTAPRREDPPVEARLVLRAREEQPRPAWLEVDGARADREVLLQDGYRIRMRVGSHAVDLEDPMEQTVARFVRACRAPGAGRMRDATLVPSMLLLEHLWPAVRQAIPSAARGG